MLSGRLITRQVIPPLLLPRLVLLNDLTVATPVVDTSTLPQLLSSETSPPSRNDRPTPTPRLTLPPSTGRMDKFSLNLWPDTELTPVSNAPHVNGGIGILQVQSTLAAPEQQHLVASTSSPVKRLTLVLRPNAAPALYPKLGPPPSITLRAIAGESPIGITLARSIAPTAAQVATLLRPLVRFRFAWSPSTDSGPTPVRKSLPPTL